MSVQAPAAPLATAWRLAYLDPARARAEAIDALEGIDPDSEEFSWALWLIALIDARDADGADTRELNERARVGFVQWDSPRGLALADEVEAMCRRREGDLAGCDRQQAEIDRRGVPRDSFDRFLAHDSRACTARLLGDYERALAHFYRALEAAEATGWDGPRITALAGLGGLHRDLFSFDDARELCERALALALKAQAKPLVTLSAANLILISCASGQPERAMQMVRFLVDHPQDQVPDALESVPLHMALAYLSHGDIEAADSWLARAPREPVTGHDDSVFRAWLQARLHLARGDRAAARDLAERVLRECHGRADTLFETLELARVACEACEQLGDAAGALAHFRRMHALYESLVGRSARARYCALRVTHETNQAAQERDLERRSREAAESDRQRLSDLNRALEAKVAETELLHAQLSEQALRDMLTGLYNRRYLFEAAPALIELARRRRSSLAVVLLDLDHFKMLNDDFGHAAGDAVLQSFAQLLSQCVRRSDVVARLGGEEFVIVMPEIDADAAVASAERLLEEFQQLRIRFRGRDLPPNSFSAGVSTFPYDADSLEQLLRFADKAMYAAKAAGRARVERAHSGYATLFTTLS